MGQSRNLATIYFGMFYIFTSCAYVAADLYNPQHLFDEIIILLKKLRKELGHVSDRNFLVNSPPEGSLEHDESCAGSFVDLFKHGIGNISNHFPIKDIHSTSTNIVKCVNTLEKNCKELKHHNRTCKENLTRLDPVHFVDLFKKFSSRLQFDHVCNASRFQWKNNRRRRAMRETNIKYC